MKIAIISQNTDCSSNPANFKTSISEKTSLWLISKALDGINTDLESVKIGLFRML